MLRGCRSCGPRSTSECVFSYHGFAISPLHFPIFPVRGRACLRNFICMRGIYAGCYLVILTTPWLRQKETISLSGQSCIFVSPRRWQLNVLVPPRRDLASIDAPGFISPLMFLTNLLDEVLSLHSLHHLSRGQGCYYNTHLYLHNYQMIMALDSFRLDNFLQSMYLTVWYLLDRSNSHLYLHDHVILHMKELNNEDFFVNISLLRGIHYVMGVDYLQYI